MTQEAKIVLFTLLLSTAALAVWQYHLYAQTLKAQMLFVQNVNKSVQRDYANGNTTSAKVTATPSATVSATPTQKTLVPSATLRPRVTTTPTATPETTPEE